MEHFVTVLDASFLPQGIALYDSLAEHNEPFVLWVICVDDIACRAIERLGLPNLRAIAVAEVERRHSELLSVKEARSRVEYCWTLTPFAPETVFYEEPTAQLATYLDADVFFMGPPSQLLRECQSDAHALLTAHAMAPEYEPNPSGEYCVQFMPFRNTPTGIRIVHWWQAKCIEWCFARFEDKRFGDQKYLDEWPSLFGSGIRVLSDPALTLAPWNLDYLSPSLHLRGIYHFQGLRLFANGEVRLWRHFGVSEAALHKVYMPYVDRLRKNIERLKGVDIVVPLAQAPGVEARRGIELSNRYGQMERWIRLPVL